MYSYDMVVIGSGPGGQKAAIAAAKLDKRGVAMVERSARLGGVCVNTGTVPSKTLREAVTYFTGLTLREVYGQSYRLKADVTIADRSSRLIEQAGVNWRETRRRTPRNPWRPRPRSGGGSGRTRPRRA